MLALVCSGVALVFAPPRGQAPLVPASAWEGSVRGELPYPRPVGPDRVLLVMGHDLGPIPWSFAGGEVPPWAGTRMLKVRGPTDRERARSCWLTGADTSRVRPAGSPRPRVPQLPTLLDRAWDERISIFVYGGETLLGDPKRKIRLREWVLPGAEVEWNVAAETVTRVRRRLDWEQVRPEQRELWMVELFGDPLAETPTPWPEETRDLIRNFLARGDPGRSMALVVDRPVEAPGQAQGEGYAVLAGFMAPGQTPAEIELEDVAPSVAALLGVGTPGGALGIPRLDLMTPRDLAGAYVALQRGFPAALDRHRAFHAGLGRPPPPMPDFGPAERHQAARAWPEAVAAGLAAREAVRGSLQKQAREIREAWKRGGRREDFSVVYGLALAAAVLLLVGLVVGWSRGGLGGMLLAPLTAGPLVLVMSSWLDTRPAGVWNALCQDPYQGLLMGAGVAMAVLAPTIPLTWRGWLRLGGAVSVACGLGALALGGLALHRYQHGILDPWGLWPAAVLVERAWLGGVLLATPVVALFLELFLGVVAWCERPGEIRWPAARPEVAPEPSPARAPAPPPPRRAAGGG